MAQNSYLVKIEGTAAGLVKALQQGSSAMRQFGAGMQQVFNAANRAGTSLNAVLGKSGKANTSGIDLLKKKYELATKSVELLERRLNDLRNNPIDTTKVANLNKQLQIATRQLVTLQTKFQQATNAKDFKAAHNFKTQIMQAELRVEKLRQALVAAQNTDVDGEALRIEKNLLRARTQAEGLRIALQQATMGAAGGGIASNLSNMAGQFTSVISKMRGAMSGFGAGFQRFFNGLAAPINMINKGVLLLNDSLRYAAQGITNFGRSLFFFVSIPIIGFLTGITKTAIDFEDSLVRVSKTTGLVGDELLQLRESIREVTKYSSLSHIELAKLAEVMGQMGVQDPKALADLVKIFNVLTVSTDMAAEEVATNMGRIANAFGWNLEKSTDSVWRLANSLNILENETAASASEIMTALTDFAPFANMLNISAADATAFAATLVSVGLSADEAGTALRNMVIRLPQHAEKLSSLMSPIADGFSSADEIIRRMGEPGGAVQVLLDLVDAAANGENEVAALLALMEVADLRGGRGLAALAGNVDLLRTNLEKANSEWSHATSLIAEYERAMSSTKAQMGILKNNINDVGITLGDAILPVINEIIQVAVPAIQYLANAFKSLSKETQMQIVMFTALGLLAGPLLMFFGQMLHAVTLFVLGFGQITKIISMVIGAIGALGPVLGSVGSVLLSWPALIIGAIVAGLKVLSKLGVDIAGFFRDLGRRAMAWGENLAGNIANGLIAGAVRYIVRAINYIANLIASFFESHSPPKDGPLSTIDQWGKALMETFLGGFKSADFSVLEDISNLIETILTSGKDDNALIGGLQQLAKSRVILAELMQTFNETGMIDENLLSQATAGLGDMGGKIATLIRLSLQYKAIREKIASLEQKRKDVLKTYDEEIAAIGSSNMSIHDKVNAIRQAQRNRDDSLKGIDKEEEALQAQAELLKEQLDAQKALVDTLNKQESIFQRIAEIMERMAEEAKNAAENAAGGAGRGGGAGELGSFAGGIGGIDSPLEGLEGEINNVAESWNSMISRFDDGKRKFQGFLDGLRGNQRKIFPYDEDMQATYDLMYDLGQRAGWVRDKFNEIKETVTSTFDQIKGKIDTALADLDLEGKIDLGSIFKGFNVSELPIIKDVIAGFEKAWNSKAFDVLKYQWERLKDAWNNLMSVFGSSQSQSAMSLVGSAFMLLGRIIGYVVGWVLGALAMLITGFLSLVTMLAATAINVGATLTRWSAAFWVWAADVGKAFESFKATASAKINEWKGVLEGKWNEVKSTVTRWADDLKKIGSDIMQGLKDGVNSVKDWYNGILDSIQTGIDKVKGLLGIRSPSTVFFNMGKDILTGLINGLNSSLGTLVSTLAGIGSTILDKIKGWFGGGSNSGIDIESLLPTTADVTKRMGEIETAIKNSLTRLKSVFTTLGSDISKSMGAALDLVSKTLSNTSGWTKFESAARTAIVSMTTQLRAGMVAILLLGKTVETLITSFARVGIAINSTNVYLLAFKSSMSSIPYSAINNITSYFNSARTAMTNANNSLNTFINNLSRLRSGSWTVQISTSGVNLTGNANGDWTGRDAAGGFISGGWNGGVNVRSASGGPVPADMPGIVGELGPELFVPNTGGTIIPNHILKRAFTAGFGNNGGGGDITININHPTVREDNDIREIVKQVKEELSKSVSRQSRYGGIVSI